MHVDPATLTMRQVFAKSSEIQATLRVMSGKGDDEGETAMRRVARRENTFTLE